MISYTQEKKLLQAVIAVACLVPLSAGLTGMVNGAAWFGGGTVDLHSHFSYLSGLLFGIGLGFLTAIPHIERHAARVRVLGMIVIIGGLGRLLSLVLMGVPSGAMVAALGMELLVTPLICWWQHGFAQRFAAANAAG